MWPRFSIKEFKKSQQRRQRECQNKRESQKSRFTMWNQTTRKFSSSFKTWMALWNSTPTEYANTWNSEERRKLISLQVSSPFGVVCATDEIKLWLSPSVKLRQNPCFSPPPVYQDVSTRHDWPVIKPLSICQSGWIDLRNAFLVILWDRWRPQTRISAKK